MADWYYMFNGQQNGPVKGSQLKSLAATGGLGPDDLVWNESMADWVPAQRVRGLTFARASSSGGMVAISPQLPEPAPAPARYAPQPVETPVEQQYAPQPSYSEYAAAPETAAQQDSYAQPPTAVSARTIEYLRQAHPWVRLFSIIMFTMTGIIVLFSLGGLLMIAGGAALATSTRSSGTLFGGAAIIGGIVITVMLLFFAALIFFPGLLLAKYASAMDRAVKSRLTGDLEEAMRAQKTFWMVIGITTLIILGLWLLGFLSSFAHRL